MSDAAAPKQTSVRTEPEEQLGLGLIDYGEALRMAESVTSTGRRSRTLSRVETMHDLLSALPTPEDLTFNHSGLCQTSLPHRPPPSNTTVWKRQAGAFTLMVRPGVMDGGSGFCTGAKPADGEGDYVGVPYGPKARLIMFHLQTEGLKSRTVPLGKNLSAFLRSLGLEVRGGPRGTIRPIREQTLRIARSTFSMEWKPEGEKRVVITDSNIVEGMDLWNPTSDEWSGQVQLSQRFHDHLREHAVPLDRRGIALLTHNSLMLDLYALFAYRLPRLNGPLRLTWGQLKNQIGSEAAEYELSRLVSKVLPTVLQAYPGANVEHLPQQGRTMGGLVLKPSKPAVPKTSVPGFRLIEGGSGY